MKLFYFECLTHFGPVYAHWPLCVFSRRSTEGRACSQKAHPKKPECLPATRKPPNCDPGRCLEGVDAASAAHVWTSSGRRRGSQHDLRCHGHGGSDRRQRHHHNRHPQPVSTVPVHWPLRSQSDTLSAGDHRTEPDSYKKVNAFSCSRSLSLTLSLSVECSLWVQSLSLRNFMALVSPLNNAGKWIPLCLSDKRWDEPTRPTWGGRLLPKQSENLTGKLPLKSTVIFTGVFAVMMCNKVYN